MKRQILLLVLVGVFYILNNNPCNAKSWQDLQTKTINVPAFTIGANNMSMSETMFDITPHFNGANFAWTSFTMRIVDIDNPNGASVPSSEIYNHHLLVVNIGQEDGWCTYKNGKKFDETIIAAAGSDYTPIVLPKPYAYLVYSNATWALSWHVLNYQNVTRTVNFQLIIKYIPFANENQLPVGLAPVGSLFITSEPHCSSEFDVPGNNTPTNVFIRSRVHVSPISGLMIMALGHYHRGGIIQQLSINNQLACEAVSQYQDGWIKEGGAGICQNMGVRLNKGDLVENVVVYNNSRSISEAMGLFLVYIFVDNTPTPLPSPIIEVVTVPEGGSSDLRTVILSIITLFLVVVLIAICAAVLVFIIRVYKLMKANYSTDFSFDT